MRVTSVGNAGFLVTSGSRSYLFDPFAWDLPILSAPPAIDLILITHGHWDHFDRVKVAALAAATGASVCGPAWVTRALAGRLPAGQLLEAEPIAGACGRRGAPAPYLKMAVGGVPITAFRSVHSRDHTSYLVELDGVRLFHDGDNEDTTVYEPAELRELDLLFLCPWRGSRWVDFLDAVTPKKWLLMHLDAQEIEQHRRGAFLPELCDHVPMEPLALLPGESLEV